MKDGDVHPARSQTSRCFQPQKPPTDDNGFLIGNGGRIDHGVGIVQITIGDHAGQILARHRNNERGRAGGDQQLVIRHIAVLAGYDFAFTVDPDDMFAKAAGYVVFGVPIVVMGDDVVIGLVATQNRAEHNPVVIAARLGVEQGYVIGVGIGLKQVFKHPARGHARADNDEFLLHVSHSAAIFLGCWAFGFGFAPCSYSSRKSRTSCRYL